MTDMMRTVSGNGTWGSFGGGGSHGGASSLAQRLRSATGPASLPGHLGSLNASGSSARDSTRGTETGLFVAASSLDRFGIHRITSSRDVSSHNVSIHDVSGRDVSRRDFSSRDAKDRALGGMSNVTAGAGLAASGKHAVAVGEADLGGGGRATEAARRERVPLPAARIRDARLQRLEAVLLLAREPLNSRKLAQFANLADGTEARTLVRKLNEAFDAAGRAFRVEEVASGYQLFTRPGFATWLRKLGHIPAEMRLSAPALETLAVIAYRQPVPRADIEAIRGVNCGEILRQLMERDLARISGRSDELGRPFLYGTTRRFLQIFGLVDLDELPRADKLRGVIARTSEDLNDQG